MSEAVAGAPVESPTPIADVSYRHYDGPLSSHPIRWWVIARRVAGAPLRRWWFWVPTVFSWLPYLIAAFIIYLPYMFRIEGMPLPTAETRGDNTIAAWCYDAFHFSLFPMFVMALLVGSGVVAQDNRANALQIYFSKPVSKLDYLFGKWLGLFMLFFGASAPAMLLLYGFAAVATSEGFFQDHPFLWLNGLGACALMATLHASILLGLSSYSRRTTITGGIYAGIYSGLGVVASVVATIATVQSGPEIGVTLAHLPLPGIMRGVAQHLFDATPGLMAFGTRGIPGVEQNFPDLWVLLGVSAALVIVSLAAATLRVHAVDVVNA